MHSRVLLDIEQDTPFVGVQVEVKRAGAFGKRGTTTRPVSGGRLDLDDVGARIAQESRREWAGDEITDLDNAQV